MSSSESDSDSANTSSRLGDCEVCGANQAKYTCPKCEVKTCSLQCVTIHKKELECNGIRDRTKFIRIKDFSDTDLLSDYRLLEECARFVYSVKRDEKKRYTRIDKDLPIHLFKLKIAAQKRGTVLQFLAQNFTRHSINTTKYHFKTNVIYWRVEWVFPNVESNLLKFVDEKCSEKTRLSELLDKYINPDVHFEGTKKLMYYKSVGLPGLKVLLKAEKIRGSSKKFFELDPSETLAENLSGKCIIEFPIVFVVLKDHAYNFEIITPEDEFEYNNSTKNQENLAGVGESQPQSGITNNANASLEKNTTQENFRHRKRPLLTEKIAEQKKKEIELEIKEQKKKKPKNLLFTTGYSSEESILSDSDDNVEGKGK